MNTILFVDDDPRILQAMRRALHGLRDEFRCLFADGGEKALKVLEEEAVDVVVSDIRMPGLDGPALLSEIRRRHPRIARIVLSGQCEAEDILRSVGPAHRFLSKPCSSDVLTETLRRTCRLRSLLGSPELQRVVTSVESLPALPLHYERLRDELQKDGASIERVGDIISRDPSMTAKVLQLVNSDFFGLTRRISDAAQAAMVLGLETMRALVLGIGAFSDLAATRQQGDFVSGLFEHSVVTAVFAKQIANVENLGARAAAESFTAGLLHDIGKLVLTISFPEQFAEVQRRCREEKDLMWRAEQAVFGTTHSEVGAYLLGLWSLPDEVVEAVAYHHRPQASSVNNVQPLTAVHCANFYSHRQLDGANAVQEQLDTRYLMSIGAEQRFADWEVLCQMTIEEDLGTILKGLLKKEEEPE